MYQILKFSNTYIFGTTTKLNYKIENNEFFSKYFYNPFSYQVFKEHPHKKLMCKNKLDNCTHEIWMQYHKMLLITLGVKFWILYAESYSFLTLSYAVHFFWVIKFRGKIGSIWLLTHPFQSSIFSYDKSFAIYCFA